MFNIILCTFQCGDLAKSSGLHVWTLGWILDPSFVLCCTDADVYRWVGGNASRSGAHPGTPGTGALLELRVLITFCGIPQAVGFCGPF